MAENHSPKSQIWQASESAVFFRSKERYGQLSNMTGNYRLRVNGISFQSPEGLYQALKFPGDSLAQRFIGCQETGMNAKKMAYRILSKHDFSQLFPGWETPGLRPDWEEIKAEAMRYTLAVKLQQHEKRFGAALRETGDRPIVEKSYRDRYWGAEPVGSKQLVGVNTLGLLLISLRDRMLEDGAQETARADIARGEAAGLSIIAAERSPRELQ